MHDFRYSDVVQAMHPVRVQSVLECGLVRKIIVLVSEEDFAHARSLRPWAAALLCRNVEIYAFESFHATMDDAVWAFRRRGLEFSVCLRLVEYGVLRPKEIMDVDETLLASCLDLSAEEVKAMLQSLREPDPRRDQE